MLKKLFYGFKRKMFWGISTIAISMIILLSLSIYFYTLSVLTSNQQRSLNKINQILVNNIESCITDMENSIFYIVSNENVTVVSFSEYFGTNEYFEAQKQIETLLTTLSKARDYDSVYIFIPENGIVISQNIYDYIWSGTPKEIKNLEAYKQIKNKEDRLGVLFDITRVSNYPANLFGVYYKITDDIFIEITMDKRFFNKILKDVYGEHFEYIIITDGDDNLVYTNDRDFVDKLFKANPDGVHSIPQHVSVDNDEYITSFQISDAVGWKVTTFTNYNAIKASTLEISILIPIITSAFVLIMLAFAYLLSNRLSMNARKLAATMKKAPKNNYMVFERINSNDEFGEISDSFINMMNELVKNRLYAKDMEIRVLQQQINPHFLYNTFDVISYFIMQNQGADAIELIEKLSDMFRYNVVYNNEYETTVDKEIENLMNYLYIIKKRIGDTLNIVFETDSGINSCIMPKFILQPIVENAFSHGFKEAAVKKELIIKGYMENGDVVFEVADNGVGLKPERLEKLKLALEQNSADTSNGFGIGLMNINSRLKLQFGEEYGIKIDSVANKGTTVKIKIPQNKKKT